MPLVKANFLNIDAASSLELAVRQSEGGDADDAPPAAVGRLFIIYLFISLYLLILCYLLGSRSMRGPPESP